MSDTIKPFDPQAGLFLARAQGHLMRKGHELTGYWTTPITDNGNMPLSTLTLTCCAKREEDN